MMRDLKMTLESARFKPWEMPVSQFGGVHVDMPQLVSVLSFQSVKDYDDYIARLKQMPRYFDENMIQMRKGMAEGLMPARILLEKVVTQSRRISHAKHLNRVRLHNHSRSFHRALVRRIRSVYEMLD